MTTNSFNSRLQPITLSAATTGSGGQTVISLSYDWHLGVNDNGTIGKIVNNRDNNRSQNFTYDALNRVASAYTDGSNWGSDYTVDAWGNLSNKTPKTGKTTGENLQQVALGNNQFSGMSYDASGNMLSDGVSTYTYDAENRIKTAAGVTYTYDGNGERVAKSTGVLYWGGSSKDALDESDGSGNLTDEFVFFNGKRIARRVVATGAVYYYFADHLGSSNVITDAGGARQAESDFYPYGGEYVILADATANHYKFTGKERDTETGVDYFFARYYSSALGRFLTPDWSATPVPVPYANLGDPQSLNLYSYVGNNPITGTDPDGHFRVAMFDSPYGNEYSDSPGPAYDPAKSDTDAHEQAQQAAASPTGIRVVSVEVLKIEGFGIKLAVTYQLTVDGKDLAAAGYVFEEKISNPTMKDALGTGVLNVSGDWGTIGPTPANGNQVATDPKGQFKDAPLGLNWPRAFEHHADQAIRAVSPSGKKISFGTNRITITSDKWGHGRIVIDNSKMNIHIDQER